MDKRRHRRPDRRRPLLWALAAVLLISAAAGSALLVMARARMDSASVLSVPPPTFVREFGAAGPDALVQPVGVAASGGRVYVADPGRGEVVVFTASGSLVATIGADQLTTPVYVALSPLDGRLYVSDRRTRSVFVFGVDGRFVRTFEPSDESGRAAIVGWQPLAIAFGEDGSLFVTDVGVRQRVLAFGPAGSYRGQSGADIPAGSSGKTLSYANGVAVTDGTLLVADSNNSRMLVLTRGLRFVRVVPFGGLPRGVAGLEDGLVAVVDTTGSEVRVVGPDGALLARAEAKGQGRGQLLLPTALAADGSGHVFVTDTGNGRVSVWRIAGSVRRDLVAEAARDPRWWAVALAAVAGMVVALIAATLGRNRRGTI